MAIIFSKSNPSATGSITFTGSGAGGMTGGNAPPSGPVITTTINGGMYYNTSIDGWDLRAGSESGTSSTLINTASASTADWFAGPGGAPPKWYTNSAIISVLPYAVGPCCVVANAATNLHPASVPLVTTFSTSTGDPVLFVSATNAAGWPNGFSESYTAGDTITTLTFYPASIDNVTTIYVTVGGVPYTLLFAAIE